MNKITNSPFVKMYARGISGAFLGILAGTILGCLIYLIQFPILWLSNLNQTVNPNDFQYVSQIWQNIAQPASLGGTFGALLGGIFGSIFGLKENTKK